MKVVNACIALLIFTHAAAISAQDSDASAQLVIKERDPGLGTNIKKNIVQSNAIPLNKVYGELTPAQQMILKAHYEKMPDDDEPPFPIRGLAPIYKSIAAGQQKLLVTGSLSMDVEVESDGAPSKVSVIESPSPDMTRFAASVLMLEHYKPAVCSGQPCRMGLPFRIEFEVRR